MQDPPSGFNWTIWCVTVWHFLFFSTVRRSLIFLPFLTESLLTLLSTLFQPLPPYFFGYFHSNYSHVCNISLHVSVPHIIHLFLSFLIFHNNLVLFYFNFTLLTTMVNFPSSVCKCTIYFPLFPLLSFVYANTIIDTRLPRYIFPILVDTNVDFSLLRIPIPLHNPTCLIPFSHSDRHH